MLYFAYGSNMDLSQMRERCPSAHFVCIAKLKDHRLAFTRKSEKRGCGVADDIPEQGRDVWGVVYEIDQRDLRRLDKCEGFIPGRRREDNAYVSEERHVYSDGNEDASLVALVYFAIQQNNPPHPNAEYKQLIVDGARYWHLPMPYIEELELIEIAT
jgi:gamma-glutamylcyclotransferase (GGCT)/AIG2-like uncharacterized protein YtfP